MKKELSIALALLVSLFIYAFYRSEKTLVNELIMLVLPLDTYREIRSNINVIPLTGLMVFSLPGGLWIFCATTLSKDFYVRIRTYKLRLFPVPILFAIGLEFCQLLQFTNGRFDCWDVVSYGIFFLLAYFSYQFQDPQENLMSPFTLRGFTYLICLLSVYLAHVSY